MGRHFTRLADTVGFELLGDALGRDVRAAVGEASKAGAVFEGAVQPLAIFREALAASIREIDTDPRGALFRRFLRDGPYEQPGRIPRSLIGKRLSDDETAEAITFMYSHMVNAFQGRLAELLAARSCARLVQRLQRQSRLPARARLYVGDTVKVVRPSDGRLAKGADLHILVEPAPSEPGRLMVAGVVEVKSHRCSPRRLQRQLGQHVSRVKSGLQVGREDFAPSQVALFGQPQGAVVRIGVVPSGWKLPRTFRLRKVGKKRRLIVDSRVPPAREDQIEQVGTSEWRIGLRWSEEVLAQVAYEMTFWYMEKVGESLYAASGVPRDWAEMTPAEAGQNAAKMMLYYAILRCRTRYEHQRAVALYNTYGFGYSLGMNFKDAKGRREMLWPQDLDELIESGKTANGCRIAQ